MGLAGAVDWWEEWQLRVLALTSLAVQFLLLIFSFYRRRVIPGVLRFIMWLAYLAGDAVAIYALATLFNRHKQQADDQNGGDRSSRLLEVSWAPILLLHLGGHDGITAYNIEDNELWSRHLVTAVSQVTVAIYVFCKSWPTGRGDKKLLQAAILLFVPGVLKCFHKAWALKRASFRSLVSSSSSSPADAENEEGGEMDPLEQYVEEAKYICREECNISTPLMSIRETSNKLFVDLSSPYPLRLEILRYFWDLGEESAYGSVRRGLAAAFFLLYTKIMTAGFPDIEMIRDWCDWGQNSRDLLNLLCCYWIQLSRTTLPWAAIGVFHHSNREAYTHTDVNITYVLFCCTAVLEISSVLSVHPLFTMFISPQQWPEMVAQYSLTEYFARKKKHSWWMWIVSLLGCREFLDQHWCMRSCFSARIITKLVRGYLRHGWTDEIKAPELVTTYRNFNNHSRHWVIKHKVRYRSQGQGQGLMRSIKRQFDESVLLWHLATDFCFFSPGSAVSEHRCAFADKKKVQTGSSQCGEESTACKAVLCRQMSNYMVYLLFVNPEMLLPGSRRNLFTAAHEELEAMFKDEKPPLKKRDLMQEIISKMEAASHGSPPPGTLIHHAWMIAKRLQRRSEAGMWKKIQSIWVEMLCFSASRCRGYLHAKALGTGGEFLSYVWLLLFHMGMETFTDRLQRQEYQIPRPEWNIGSAPPPLLHRLPRSAPARMAAESMIPSPEWSPPSPLLHQLPWSAPASPHRFPGPYMATEYMQLTSSLGPEVTVPAFCPPQFSELAPPQPQFHGYGPPQWHGHTWMSRPPQGEGSSSLQLPPGFTPPQGSQPPSGWMPPQGSRLPPVWMPPPPGLYSHWTQPPLQLLGAQDSAARRAPTPEVEDDVNMYFVGGSGVTTLTTGRVPRL